VVPFAVIMLRVVRPLLARLAIHPTAVVVAVSAGLLLSAKATE
jgi:hypothetical protein